MQKACRLLILRVENFGILCSQTGRICLFCLYQIRRRWGRRKGNLRTMDVPQGVQACLEILAFFFELELVGEGIAQKHPSLSHAIPDLAHSLVLVGACLGGDIEEQSLYTLLPVLQGAVLQA